MNDIVKKAEEQIEKTAQELLSVLEQQKVELIRLRLTPTPKHILYKVGIPDGTTLMTGKQWYDRFKRLTKGKVIAFDDDPRDAVHQGFAFAEAAVRRAAGLGPEK